jgi:dipeptidyl aminopeptidase/acylaminoacyl peptidase
MFRFMAICWMALSMAAAAAQTAPPPAIDFFKPAVLADASLSPSGRYMAATRYLEQTGRHGLVIVDLGGQRSLKVVAAYSDIDVQRAYWAGEDQLVFTLTDRRASYMHQRGQGLYAVDREGRNAPRILIRRTFEPVSEVRASSTELRTRPRDNSLDPYHLFHSVLRDGTPRVLVTKRSYAGDWELIGSELLLVNVLTGRSEPATQDAPANVQHWLADQQGRARVAYVMAGAKRQIHWRPSADAPWTLLREQARYIGDGGIEPLMLAADDKLFVRMRGERDTEVLATLDAKQPEAKPRVLVAVDGFDYQGSIEVGPGDKVLGVHVLSDAWSTAWFDAEMKATQAAVDKLLPSTVNLLDCGACDKPQRVLVQAFNDRQPGVYYLYELATQKLEPISATRPWIKPAQMGERSFERIAARDGLQLPLHITKPVGVKGAAPTVVLVHGGPWVRGGDWRWQAESQFLASRGYLVIEPEFRGSTGYGERLFSAGFKQWGLAMQDDLVDALAWAVKQGLADPKRVCIAGGSYGGYAALMGLLRHPEQFRCGISFMGVTDVELMYENSWSDLSGDWKRYGMPEMIGDRKRDAEQLTATSPLKQAARIKQPMLIAYGGQDRRVPPEHADRFLAAVGEHNKSVERVLYRDEGHGWSLDKNEADFWTRVETFLAKQLSR